MYNGRVKRFALLLVVGVLCLSASGLPVLAIGEPCAEFEQSQATDSACPPTCVTCGCCAQAVEPQSLRVATLVSAAVPVPSAFIPHLLKTDPRDILHVPKSLLV